MRRELGRAFELTAMSSYQRDGKEGRSTASPVLSADVETPVRRTRRHLPSDPPVARRRTGTRATRRCRARPCPAPPRTGSPGDARALSVLTDHVEYVTSAQLASRRCSRSSQTRASSYARSASPGACLVAAIEAKQGEYGQRPDSKCVVVQLLGEPERGKRVTFRPCQAANLADSGRRAVGGASLAERDAQPPREPPLRARRPRGPVLSRSAMSASASARAGPAEGVAQELARDRSGAAPPRPLRDERARLRASAR